jgi:hypothetical protein
MLTIVCRREEHRSSPAPSDPAPSRPTPPSPRPHPAAATIRLAAGARLFGRIIESHAERCATPRGANVCADRYRPTGSLTRRRAPGRSANVCASRRGANPPAFSQVQMCAHPTRVQTCARAAAHHPTIAMFCGSGAGAPRAWDTGGVSPQQALPTAGTGRLGSDQMRLPSLRRRSFSVFSVSVSIRHNGT